MENCTCGMRKKRILVVPFAEIDLKNSSILEKSLYLSLMLRVSLSLAIRTIGLKRGWITVMSDFQCPFCPCVFSCKTDLDLHLKTFGNKSHFKAWKKAHENLEKGVGF